MNKRHLTFLAGTVGLCLAPLNAAEPEGSLESVLAAQVESSGLPSIAAIAISSQETLDSAAVGVRKIGDPTRVTLEDKYHLGSCTKSLTATLAAILVESGSIRWDSTIGEALESRIETIHPEFASVTLDQLLAHTGGFAANPPQSTWLKAWKDQGQLAPTEQRLSFASDLLANAPSYQPGVRSVYSNLGYAIAGVMLETVTGQAWESLLAEKVFHPLGMESAGFRAPASPGAVDETWGHRNGIAVPPGPQSDNPDAIGPAATAHASITDWAKFARYHLKGEPAPLLKDANSLAKLRSTLKNSENHAVGGWLAHDIEPFGGRAFQMVGSNTMWMAMMWILPEKDLAVLVATNDGGPQAFANLDQVATYLFSKYID
ncbi:serine hydrolase domain-containing protein [Pelagicoccus sp. SDUM812003]|uniref:serine hydrolase domain-containing protein n=1 Tax=Pelagicoccus sp. SDUM812003 TaxID=3041267 RepID=UPI00280CD815|nr:serine hydrolase domain-containing protein [Pelagicoccus sp. SDUM812003]MDQ8202261.1 serine hydrolase [Pelagicoccus sp. SDUM812003]